METQSVYPLFGPVQTSGAETNSPRQSLLRRLLGRTVAPSPSDFRFIGAALSGSAHKILFERDLREIAHVRAWALWHAGSSSNRLRFVAFDDGPSNLEILAEVAGTDDAGPRSIVLDLTDKLRRIRAERRPKQIGFQIANGTIPWTLYCVKFDIYWQETDL